MKIWKRILTGFTCFIMVFSLSGNVFAAAPTNEDKDITIASSNDIKGCYYTVDNTMQSHWTDERCFKDERLAEVVYQDIVKFYQELLEDGDSGPSSSSKLTFETNADDSITFKNTNMRAILAGFRGDVKAKWTTASKTNKIDSIQGLQFLIHAGYVDLRGNNISDLTELNVSAITSGTYDDRHYGYDVGEDPDNPGEARNVTWDLGGNPFGKIPYTLGGRLNLLATQTQSSQYPDADVTFRFKRDEAETFSGILDIYKCDVIVTDVLGNAIDVNGNKITDIKDAQWRPVNVNTINFIKAKDNTPGAQDIPVSGIKLDVSKGDVDTSGNAKGFTNQKLYFKDLQTSRRQRIGVGIDQELHADTTDEFGTVTPQSQSFKYYIDPYLYVYDTVDVASTIKAQAKLTKKDEDTNKPLAGAEYILYKDDVEIQKYITDASGSLFLFDLDKGMYTLVETKAPEGYVLDATPITFTITGGITISGGTSTFTETQNTLKTYTAEPNQTFIAGSLNDPIVLELEDSNNKPSSVNVSYRRLLVNDTPMDTVVETYTTIEAAQKAINDHKNNGEVLGSIKVEAEFVSTKDNMLQFTHTNVKKPTPPVPPTPPIDPKPEDPTTPETPTTPEKPEVPKKDGVKTGDSSNVYGLIALAGTAIVVAGFVLYNRKNKE